MAFTRIEGISDVTDADGRPMLYFIVDKPGHKVFSTVEYVDGLTSRWRTGNMSKFDGNPLTAHDRWQIGLQLDAWLATYMAEPLAV